MTQKYTHNHIGKEDIEEYAPICISTEYQPIKDIYSGKTIGYEALARFSMDGKSFDTEKYLKKHFLAEKSLYSIERLIKEHQIRNRPEGKTLYLNLSAHACQTLHALNFWQSVMEDNDDIVFELIEKTDRKERDFPIKLFEIAEGTGTKFALDDYLCENYIHSPFLFLNANVVKLDKMLLKCVREDKDYGEVLKKIVSFCNDSGKQVVAEGIETKEAMELIKEYGIRFGQGFYFKNEFIYVE